ncbi:MAG: Ethanolamine utilization protein EutN/carboxysome structural protein Ccml [Clostridia bacterium]|jgi:ethanolamine utilization protein EutN|nr:Ethanolamine utilization protein EutN/carboxysome structural protein Ccml [Clostridia bacterium]
MFIGKVLGNVVSTYKHKELTGKKLLIVQDLANEDPNQTMIALDAVGAGIGEIVLVTNDGGVARDCLHLKTAPINLAVIGILDHYS